MNISRASVSQTCKHLEENNLIKKVVGKRYNILYEASVDLQKRIGGVQEQITACRVHNCGLKFHVLSQDHPLSTNGKTGYNKKWMMRGGERFAYWYPGKAGEISCTVTVHPRTIVIRMDAKQTILAKDVSDAESRAFQHLIYIRQKFIDSQRLFGVNFEIEPTGQRLGKVHYGFPMPENHMAAQEVLDGKVPGWFGDRSLDELGEKGLVEGETTSQKNATKMERALNFPDIFPEMIRTSLDPLSANLQRVEALIQGGTTSEMKMNQLMGVIGSLLERLLVLEKKLESKG
jgi:hypothetical protein